MLGSRHSTRAAAAILTTLLGVSPALAGESASIATPADLDAALEAHGDRFARDLSSARALLQRDDVRLAAGAAGLDLREVSAALALLEPHELEELNAAAALLDASLAGGQAPVVSGGTGSHFPLLYVAILLAIVAVFLFV